MIYGTDYMGPLMEVNVRLSDGNFRAMGWISIWGSGNLTIFIFLFGGCTVVWLTCVLLRPAGGLFLLGTCICRGLVPLLGGVTELRGSGGIKRLP